MMNGKQLLKEIREAKVPQDHIALWWLGQMGYAMKCGETAILMDAFLTNLPGRRISPLFTPEEADFFTAVIGSHNHDDHMDLPAWEKMNKVNPKALFLMPAPHVHSIAAQTGIPAANLVGIIPGESIHIGSFTVEAIPAAHELIETDAEGHSLHLSYVFNRRILHGGDTCRYEGQAAAIRAFGPLAAMILPINGRDAERYLRNCIGNMTFQEAVDLAGTVRPTCAVPGHFDMFDGNLGDPEAFRNYLQAKYPGITCWIPSYGTRIDF